MIQATVSRFWLVLLVLVMGLAVVVLLLPIISIGRGATGARARATGGIVPRSVGYTTQPETAILPILSGYRRAGLLAKDELRDARIWVDSTAWADLDADARKRFVQDMSYVAQLANQSPIVSILNVESGTLVAEFGNLGVRILE